METPTPPVKIKRYYDLHIKWKHGFQYHSYIPDHALKSTKSSLEKLEWFKEMEITEITEEEYHRKLDITYESNSSASGTSKKKRKKKEE
jgi:hypothetical protein